MDKSRRQLILFFLATALVGVLLHYLYRLLPCFLTAFLSPVNESLWEHVKLLFWPYLIASAILSRLDGSDLRPRQLTLLMMCAAMLIFGYIYHIMMEGRAFAVDIGLYLFLLAACFLLPQSFHPPFTGLRWALVPPLTVLVGLAIVLFSIFPPVHILFLDLSGVNTWSTIPY